MAILAAFLIWLALVGAVVWAFFRYDRWLHKKNGWHK